MSKPDRDPVDLETFLFDLPSHEAGEARAAAGRMDELERTIDYVRDIETRYWPVGAVGGCLSFFAAVIVLYRSETTNAIMEALGFFTVGVMAVSFGIVLLLYGFMVRRRSEVDAVKFELNRAHFVPHDAYYFPAETPAARGRVVYFTPRKLKPQILGPHDRVRPGSSWW